MKIEYDSRKAALNLQKHGVSFEEVASVLFDEFLITNEDSDTENEQRFFSLGKSEQDRILVVVWTLRDDTIRLISARKATKMQRKEYEDQF